MIMQVGFLNVYGFTFGKTNKFGITIPIFVILVLLSILIKSSRSKMKINILTFLA